MSNLTTAERSLLSNCFAFLTGMLALGCAGHIRAYLHYHQHRGGYTIWTGPTFVHDLAGLVGPVVLLGFPLLGVLLLVDVISFSEKQSFGQLLPKLGAVLLLVIVYGYYGYSLFIATR